MSVFSKNLLIAFLAAFLQNAGAASSLVFAPRGDDGAPAVPQPPPQRVIPDTVRLNLCDFQGEWGVPNVVFPVETTTLQDVLEHALSQDFYYFFPGVYEAEDFEIVQMAEGWVEPKHRTLGDLIRADLLNEGDVLGIIFVRGSHIIVLEWFHYFLYGALVDVPIFHRDGGRPLYYQERLRRGFRPDKFIPEGRISALREVSRGNYSAISARAAKQLNGKLAPCSRSPEEKLAPTLPAPVWQQVAEFAVSHRDTTSTQLARKLAGLPKQVRKQVAEYIVDPESKNLFGLRNHLRSWQFQTFVRGYPELGVYKRRALLGRDAVEAFRVAGPGPGADYVIQMTDFDWCVEDDPNERPTLRDLERIIRTNGGGWVLVKDNDHVVNSKKAARIHWVRLEVHLDGTDLLADGTARPSATLAVGLEPTVGMAESRTVVWQTL